jgi:hypothetical protein
MKLLLIDLLAISFGSCRQFNADYETRLTGVKKVCPTCTFHTYNSTYYAIDTSKQPNSVYIVDFCSGFVYSSSTVDHLIKIN